jgi:alkylation response protein AidB-like acyl-CoA dehydrogenase
LDFDLNDDQQAILEAVDSLLDQYAGPARAIELQPKAEYDHVLHAALIDAGFADVARDESTGGLEAALIVEATSRAGGVVAIGAQALVAPAASTEPMPGPIALTTTEHHGPVRYAAHARTLLVLDGDDLRRVDLAAGECAPVPSNFGYPMGRVPAELASRGDALGADAAERVRQAWRLALASEAVGCMDAALHQTVDYLKERRQFGRAIGSFQAVQQRLAQCAIQLEASRWLSREAAHKSGDGEAAATAAAFTLAAADQIFAETHQLSGAIGFTREHDLHVWSMRLHALRLELGGVAAHRRAIVAERWRGPGAGLQARP